MRSGTARFTPCASPPARTAPMTGIDRLTTPCPPPPTARPTDRSSTERALGMPLPTACERIADAYGAGNG
ncbi:hypothetical protein GCM10010275_08740 [Streptomyces litmocidini]|nr:hypothetical protein GCM10010275_08740 [Streptomyces litmocidini]